MSYRPSEVHLHARKLPPASQTAPNGNESREDAEFPGNMDIVPNRGAATLLCCGHRGSTRRNGGDW